MKVRTVVHLQFVTDVEVPESEITKESNLTKRIEVGFDYARTYAKEEFLRMCSRTQNDLFQKTNPADFIVDVTAHVLPNYNSK